jgi:hypothetical protein|tara:strand:- start:647 stop:1018 length:372 start_codon:yes stop_codon:yes gene_type:complete
MFLGHKDLKLEPTYTEDKFISEILYDRILWVAYAGGEVYLLESKEEECAIPLWSCKRFAHDFVSEWTEDELEPRLWSLQSFVQWLRHPDWDGAEILILGNPSATAGLALKIKADHFISLVGST